VDRVDVELARRAVERGWVSNDQVDALDREGRGPAQQSTVGGRGVRPFGVQLVASGLLTEAQHEQLQQELHQAGLIPAPARLIGQILLSQRAVTPDHLGVALDAQRSQRAAGRMQRLGEILVARGFVRTESVAQALRVQGKEVMECTGCRARFNVLGFRTGTAYACPRCRARLKSLVGDVAVLDSTTASAIKVAEDSELPADLAAMPGPKVNFGKFVLVGELFRSPQGTVFRAWQRDHNRLVAFLFDREGSADPSAIAAAAPLRLGGLVERGEFDGRPYLTMEIP
jgi:hypothetical protein